MRLPAIIFKLAGLDHLELYGRHEARHHPDAEDDQLVAQVAAVAVEGVPDGSIPAPHIVVV